MKFGPIILHLTEKVCSPSKLRKHIFDYDSLYGQCNNLCKKIQEKQELIDSPLTLTGINPWYSGPTTGVTGYEVRFLTGQTRIMEFSFAPDRPVEHHVDLGHELPSSVVTSMRGRKLGDIIGEMGIMEPFWDRDAEILDIVSMNDRLWAVFQPKQKGSA